MQSESYNYNNVYSHLLYFITTLFSMVVSQNRLNSVLWNFVLLFFIHLKRELIKHIQILLFMNNKHFCYRAASLIEHVPQAIILNDISFGLK